MQINTKKRWNQRGVQPLQALGIGFRNIVLTELHMATHTSIARGEKGGKWGVRNVISQTPSQSLYIDWGALKCGPGVEIDGT